MIGINLLAIIFCG